MDLSLSKFRICALPQTLTLNESWHPNLPIIRLLGVDMRADHIPEFINFWTSRYRLANNLELAKKLKAALLESHRFMKLLSTIDDRWKSGNLRSGTTGGRILYRRRLNDTRDQGQELWRYLLQLLRHSQRLALEQSGNKETEGWIDAEVEREFEGETFFNIFYDNYLFGPPAEGYEIGGLFLGFESWNDKCKTWIDAADALSSKTVGEPAVGYFNSRRRPQGQHTLTVRQTTRPQNSSGPRHVRLADQTTDDTSIAVSPPKSPCLSSTEGARGGDVPPTSLPVMGCSTPRPGPKNRPIILPMRPTTRPMQNSSDFNQVAPPGQATHVVPPLRPATRADRPRRIPPRSGYFTRRPGRLGRLIQPIRQQSGATIRPHQNSSGQNPVPPPRHEPTIASSPPAPNPRSPSAASEASEAVALPGQASSIGASQLSSAPSPRWPSPAGVDSGEAAPPAAAMVAPSVRPAPNPGEVAPRSQALAIVAPSLRPAAGPHSPSPAGGPSREVDTPGTRSPRGRLNYNRLIREHFGVDLDLPPEERVYPEKNFVLVDGVHTLRVEQFPSLSAAGQTVGDVAPSRPAPTIVTPSSRPATSPRSPSAAEGASGEIAPPRPRPVELSSAVSLNDLDTDME